MKINCPVCKEKAELTVEVFAKDKTFNNPANDWRLTCEHCSVEKEAKFSSFNRVVLLMLYLFPIVISWKIFLLYSSQLGNGWMRFLVFLIHLAVGIYVGDRLSTGYCARFIFRNRHTLGKL